MGYRCGNRYDGGKPNNALCLESEKSEYNGSGRQHQPNGIFQNVILNGR